MAHRLKTQLDSRAQRPITQIRKVIGGSERNNKTRRAAARQARPRAYQLIGREHPPVRRAFGRPTCKASGVPTREDQGTFERVPKLSLLVHADRCYVIQSGLETQFFKNFLAGLLELPEGALREPLALKRRSKARRTMVA